MEMICSNSEDALRRGEIRKRTKMYATLLENAKEKNLVYAAQIYIDQYWFRELSDQLPRWMFGRLGRSRVEGSPRIWKRVSLL
jgi:hypothetical protein